MTYMLFREDPYLEEAEALVMGHTPEGGVICDASIFYPTGGGQPGDSGALVWDAGRLPIATTVKGQGTEIVFVPADASALPPVGTKITQRLDWSLRHRHMRVHTALHLLTVVIAKPVTGGAIGPEKGRLDFDMDTPLADKQEIEDVLNHLIERDLPIWESWISDDELLADPSIVKTMSVMPPLGQGRVRLIGIGQGAAQVDLQPCGGTHVARTSEIGRIRVGKIEKKGRQNRRISILLD